MGEEKDLAIKLFGKKIVLTENEKILVVSGQNSGDLGFGSSKVDNFVVDNRSEDVKDHLEGESENRPQDKAPVPFLDETKGSSESSESPKTPSINEENATLKPPHTENDQSDTTDSQQKTLKKPDKILPCPRCNSMDTKFCYYNNYNVSQPRHFCKGCQRYWTAGGTMRNMPVGAGRRKNNKNSVPQCHHLVVSEALHAARIDALGGNHNTTLKSKATVLSFGADSQISESMTSNLTAKKKVPTSIQNGLYKQGTSFPCKGGQYGDDCFSGSSIKASNSPMEVRKDVSKEPEVKNINGFYPQVPFHHALPWPFPWNPAVPMHGVCPSGFQFPYFPSPYWNYSVPGSWNLPWLPPPSHVTNQDTQNYVSKSPKLGKHSREGDLVRPISVVQNEDSKQNDLKPSVLVPKTLRIDDLDEEAKGSIFSSLGIKNDSISKAFQPKKDDKSDVIRPSPALQANPAALSRSLRFQERA